MILDNTNNWSSPVRYIEAKVELYEGSTLASTYTAQDALKSFTVERIGEDSKFFGFGTCQKINLHLIDVNREINISTANSIKVYTKAGGNYVTAYPEFYVSEVHRDENTNELSITAYDLLYKATELTMAEILTQLEPPYTVIDVAANIAVQIGGFFIDVVGLPEGDNSFAISYPTGANLEGTETIRECLNAIAEATQTIYYIDKYNYLVFKRLDASGDAVLNIDKENYIELDSKTNRRLAAICSATELGDNVIASLEQTGTTQYVRNNPFWDIREDIAELVENALAAVGGLTINQFECSWRGNPLLEYGDKISIVTKDNGLITSYVLNDTLTYDGGLEEECSWSYEDTGETESNPTSLGDALKKTYARVDKANAEIEMVAGETASIKLTTDSIVNSVSQMDENLTDVIAEVNTKVTAEDVSFTIQTAMGEGIERVTTTTGFTFNEEGLHISKENSEITTSITEDGMRVYKDNDEVLVADNLGVKAEDLHATTFLIIGNNSRLEDYGNRTGCFWIGG